MPADIILFRPDLGPGVGLGHVSRCAAIASALDKRRLAPAFLLPPGKAVPLAGAFRCVRLRARDADRREAAETVSLLRARRPALFVVDSYSVTRRYLESLRREIPSVPVLAFDDGFGRVPEPAYGILSLGPHADPGRYPPSLLGRSAIGAAFTPLRPCFTRSLIRPPRKEARRVLVLMGSADPERQAARAAGILRAVPGPARIDAVMGPWHGPDPVLERTAARDPRFRVHRNPPDLPRLMSRADLALTAGGVSAVELAFLGVPALVLTVAENQEAAAARLSRAGAAVNLGDFRRVSDARIRASLLALLADAPRRRALSAAGRALVDGRGAGRTARFLEETAGRYHRDAYSVREVASEYEGSSGAPREFERVRWGSAEGMLNRFRLAGRVVDWRRVSSWLDVGCGTGAFLREILSRRKVRRCVGIDLSPSLLAQARAALRGIANARFLRRALGESVPGGPFDLVTAVGVLQKCGLPLAKAVALMAESVRPGGRLFVTTKCQDWVLRQGPGFRREPGHHWFLLDDLAEAFALAGLDIVRWEGFEPRSGRLCAAGRSHSLFVLGRKPA